MQGIDIAGAGGTSWSEVEAYRQSNPLRKRIAHTFASWGTPTALALQQVRHALPPAVPIFASGGIRTGQDVAKCVALGASLVGLASPFLKRAVESAEAVVDEMHLLQDEVRIAMFCSGAQNIQALRRPGVLVERDAMRYNI